MKIIAVYNPIRSRSGSTCIALGLATSLSWFAHKKVLLSNHSGDKELERMIKKVPINYTLDNIFMLQDTLDTNKLKTIVNPINDKLDIIGEYISDMNRGSTENTVISNYLDVAKKIYDYIVLDLSSNMQEYILEKADILLAVIPFEESKAIVQYPEKTIPVINDIFEELIPKKPEGDFFLKKDINIYYEQTIEKKLYEYIATQIHSKDDYMQQLTDLTYEVLSRADDVFKDSANKPNLLKKLFNIS